MNLFYAAFGSCRRQGNGKQACYVKAKHVVKEFGRGGPHEGRATHKRKCKFGRTRKGTCRKARR